MKINGSTPVYFDIETTGFSAFEDEFVCATHKADVLEIEPEAFDGLEKHSAIVHTELGEVVNYLGGYTNRKIIVTYNDENWSGGFDFPWLRSKCLQEGIDWHLGGVKHLDLLPLVRKYLNTTGYEPPSKSDLYSDDLKRLAEANGIEYKNMDQCYEELEQLDNVDWLDYEMQPDEDNSLQSVYQKLFDPEAEEEYISGKKIPELYEQYKTYIRGGDYQNQKADQLMEQIREHNRRDVERLKKVAEKVIPVLPDWEIKRNINKL